MRRTLVGRSLSAKILLLTMACLFLGEVLIFVPSIARFRANYLEERIAAARLASLGADDAALPEMDKADALSHAGVLALTVHGAHGRTVKLGEPVPVAADFDLRDESWDGLIRDADRGAAPSRHAPDQRTGPSLQELGTTVEITIAEAPVEVAMVDYSIRIVSVSVILSLLVAGMMIVGLQRMIVRPARPDHRDHRRVPGRPDAAVDREVTGRRDRRGGAGLLIMRLRPACRADREDRLAALGAGMSRIGHDLRNILSTAVLISDRLEASADPAVRQVRRG